MIPLSLTPLVSAAAHGDERAWHELVDRFTPTLRRAVGAYRLTGPEAEDVMQTTWLALVESVHTLRDAEALPGWLATTARRQSLRARNSGGREVPLADLPEEPVPAGSKLLAHPRVILTPHSAFYSIESERDLRRKAAQNIVTFLKTGRPDYIVVAGTRR